MGEKEQYNTLYLNEKQVAEHSIAYENECEGSPLLPNAFEGWLCVYQAATAESGSQLAEWKSAGFFGLEDLEGNINASHEGVPGERPLESEEGELVVFRTTGFKGLPETATTCTGATGCTLNADGSWAIRAK
jgi:hypothetical protein